MPTPLLSASGSAKLAITVSLLAFASLFSMLANVDTAIQGEFNTALARYSNSPGIPATATPQPEAIAQTRTTRTTSDLAASEDHWLGHAGRTNTVPIAFKSAVEIGDTLTIATRQGKRVFNIETIAALPPPPPSATASKTASSMFVLTAREAGQKNGSVMRLLIEDTSRSPLRHATPAPERNL